MIGKTNATENGLELLLTSYGWKEATGSNNSAMTSNRMNYYNSGSTYLSDSDGTLTVLADFDATIRIMSFACQDSNSTCSYALYINGTNVTTASQSSSVQPGVATWTGTLSAGDTIYGRQTNSTAIITVRNTNIFLRRPL